MLPELAQETKKGVPEMNQKLKKTLTEQDQDRLDRSGHVRID